MFQPLDNVALGIDGGHVVAAVLVKIHDRLPFEIIGSGLLRQRLGRSRCGENDLGAGTRGGVDSYKDQGSLPETGAELDHRESVLFDNCPPIA